MNPFDLLPVYLLGIATALVWIQFLKEANRGPGGEIIRIIKLKTYQ